MAPRYEPEVNNEQDILDQGYDKIYTWNGDKEIPMLFNDMKLRFPKHYEMVGRSLVTLINRKLEIVIIVVLYCKKMLKLLSTCMHFSSKNVLKRRVSSL